MRFQMESWNHLLMVAFDDETFAALTTAVDAKGLN